MRRQPDRGEAGRQAPAYRGLCYLVFERLPLAQFGNRIPQHLGRAVPGGGRAGAGDPRGDGDPRRDRVRLRPGAAGADRRAGRDGEREHASVARGVSDWTLSIDELQALCPNLEHVALVVAWFGDDLRCGAVHDRAAGRGGGRAMVEGATWSVAGLARGDGAGGVDARRRAGLWRHAVGRVGAGGDRRPQGARAGGDALSVRADGHAGGQRPARSLWRTGSRPIRGAGGSPAIRRRGRRDRRTRRRGGGAGGGVRRDGATGAFGGWCCTTPSWR